MISTVFHPDYTSKSEDWDKWRTIYDGGREFIDTYLVTYSARENSSDFIKRKKVTPTPNFAKAAVNDIKNSIFQRLTDVQRRGGSNAYKEAVQGGALGVDLHGASMNAYIGTELLSELLVMSRVGIYVDMPPAEGPTLKHTQKLQPYLYKYRVEDIQSWTKVAGSENEYSSVLLKDYVTVTYDQTGLPSDTKIRYRHVFIGDDGFVHIRFYEKMPTTTNSQSGLPDDPQEQQVDIDGNPTDVDVILKIKKIPFVMVELSDSLLADVANHQIALLNMESSDIAYALQANFPFYVEQEQNQGPSHILPADNDADGTAATASTGGNREIAVGANQGRTYGKGMDAPSFIHPSPEPLQASMGKQAALKADIRALVNLNLSNVQATVASAESKRMDDRGLESGLSSIGLVLEHAERRVAYFWHLLQDSSAAWSVKYPEKWSLKTDDDRRKDASALRDLRDTIPSPLFQKAISKEIALLTLGSKVSNETLAAIETEIDEADAHTTDPETIFRLIELGVMDLELAAELLGLPENTVAKAAEQHADRLVRIAESQSKGNGDGNPSARGVGDLDDNPGQGSRDEKNKSRDNTQEGTPTKKVRGDAKHEATL